MIVKMMTIMLMSYYENVIAKLRCSLPVPPSPGGCGVGIKENVKQGVIFSPRWPLHYPQYVDCVWEVSSRKNMNLKLSFYNFEVLQQSPCGEYLIDVRSGGNEKFAPSLTL